jgi:deoxyribodipyrimidine photo-lyase
MTTLHWFRGDLRLADNRALTAAVADGPVVPVFILDDAAAGGWPAGGASRWWLDKSLLRLDEALQAKGSRLIVRLGSTVEQLRALATETGATSVTWTRQYEPWATALDAKVRTALAEMGVGARQFRGSLLFEPEDIRNGSGEPFKVYTPFGKACRASAPPKAPIAAPNTIPAPERWPAGLMVAALNLHPHKPDWSGGMAEAWQPGEGGAHARLEEFLAGPVKQYHEMRDVPSVAGTSRLSPHLHYGEISPHACWHATHLALQGSAGRGGEKFLSEILWREFRPCPRRRSVRSSHASPGPSSRVHARPGSAGGRAIPLSTLACGSFGRLATCTTAYA